MLPGMHAAVHATGIDMSGAPPPDLSAGLDAAPRHG